MMGVCVFIICATVIIVAIIVGLFKFAIPILIGKCVVDVTKAVADSVKDRPRKKEDDNDKGKGFDIIDR